MRTFMKLLFHFFFPPKKKPFRMTVKTQVSADLQVPFVSLIRALHYPEPPTDTNATFRSPHYGGGVKDV